MSSSLHNLFTYLQPDPYAWDDEEPEEERCSENVDDDPPDMLKTLKLPTKFEVLRRKLELFLTTEWVLSVRVDDKEIYAEKIEELEHADNEFINSWAKDYIVRNYHNLKSAGVNVTGEYEYYGGNQSDLWNL